MDGRTDARVRAAKRRAASRAACSRRARAVTAAHASRRRLAAQVNATINYTRRYLLALNNLFVFLLVGLLLERVVIGSDDWVDAVYWTVVSMTTIGYGDYTPSTALGKIFVMLYLPISVAALAQALSDVQAITLRRGIRETDYGDRLAGEFLKAECLKNAGDANESITEGEFLVYVLVRRGIVDEQTIAAVRRQFRELVRDGGNPREPLETRTFDNKRLFEEKLKRGQVRQRAASQAPGARDGSSALVDLRASDGGYEEWRSFHWEPLIQAGMPPAGEEGRRRFVVFGGKSPLGLLTGLVRRSPLI